MMDLKVGVCFDNFWFNWEICCWFDKISFEGIGCIQWKIWVEVIIGVNDGVVVYVINYFFYIVIVLLFGFFVVIFVWWFVFYVCGSGILEVRGKKLCYDRKLDNNVELFMVLMFEIIVQIMQKVLS